MAENDFEKQVQKNMLDFGLQPSTGVWDKVETRIKKERKRRFLIFLFLVGLLAGSTATALIIILPGKSSVTSNTANLPVSSNKTHSSVNIPQQNKSNDGSITIQSNKQSSPVNPGLNNSKTGIPGPIYSTRNNKVLVKNPADEKPSAKVSPGSVLKNEEPIATVAKQSSEKVERPVKDSLNESKTVITASENFPPANSLKDTVAVSKETKKEKKLKHWTLVLSAGRSSIVNRFRLLSERAYLGGINFQSSGSTPFTSSRPVFLKPSFSFSGGIYFNQVLSEKLEINWGIKYQFLSTRMHAGRRVDSTLNIQGSNVNRFYRPSNLSDDADYTTQYHFLGLSGELSWLFIDKEKFKSRWNNGFSFEQLLFSNYLRFDPQQRVYYKNREFLKKSQLFFNTALEFPIGNNISISPFGSFSLTSVFKAHKDTTFQYTNYGIQLRIPLNKNKSND